MNCAGPVGDSIPANKSRFATPADRDAALRKAKEAGMPKVDGTPMMMGQTGVMAMRMGGGGDTQGAIPCMETATTTGICRT